MQEIAIVDNDLPRVVIIGAGFAGSSDREKEVLTKFVVVEGGPAGVEMAGSLAEFKKYLLKNDYPEINGDISSMITDKNPSGHPMVAQVAIQQGKALGKNIISLVSTGQLNAPFTYRNKGSMATIGKKDAVADLKILSGKKENPRSGISLQIPLCETSMSFFIQNLTNKYDHSQARLK